MGSERSRPGFDRSRVRVDARKGPKGAFSLSRTQVRSLGANSSLPFPPQAQSKGGSKASKSATSKLLSTQSHLSTLGSALTSALPPFLNASQALDASHAAFLKEALIRYGTISSDLGRERMEAGERVLVAVFSIDEESEMQGWALRESMRAGAGVVDRARPVNGAEFGAPSSNEGVREQTIQEEPNSLRAPVQERERVPCKLRLAASPLLPADFSFQPSLALPLLPSPPSPSPLPPPSALPTLLPLDLTTAAPSETVVEVAPSSPLCSSGTAHRPSPDPPSTGTSTSRLRRNSRHTIGSRSIVGRAMMWTTGWPGGKGAPSRRSASRSCRSRREDSSGVERRWARLEADRARAWRGGRARSCSRRRRGRSSRSRRSRRRTSTRRGTRSRLLATTSSLGSRKAAERTSWTMTMKVQRRRAFLLPPRRQQCTNKRLPRSALPVARVPNVAIAPSTITETDSDRQAALERVKSTLLSSKPLGGPTSSPLLGSPNVGGVTRRGTARGRRDVRTTTYNPVIPDDVPLGRLLEQQRAQEASALSTPSRMPSIPFTSSPTGAMFGERANSMLSVASTVGGRVGVVDPFEGATTPGLRASIVETVNVLSKGGVVSRVMITGEISLSHRLAAGASTDGVRIRIAHFEQFEKAAPNSAYLSPVPDSPGEYLVSPSLSTTPSSAVVLKYQLHVPAGSEDAFVPLHVRANWRCEPTQTRVMVVYAPNPSAKLASSGEESPFGEEEEARLGDVSFQVPMSVNAVTFQAKPAAVWSPEHAKLTFAVQGVGLGGGEEGKLLASIATESQAVAQPVAVRWKCAGRCVSGVGVEVVGGEQVEEVLRTTVSGKYLVAP